MRSTGLTTTIHQTLTPESATVLNHSIAEARRRNHSQTTPLHAAATLLSSPSGYLRHACIYSHPNSTHPLRSRAIELCFSVALERLPTAAAQETEPPISNALMAALKRAQAHQRRGCTEQQQLLAVKVELDQLIISILDDPSVSRVMREAGFSSPAVKAAIEKKSMNVSAISNGHHRNLNFGAGGVLPMTMLSNPSRNSYLDPRLQQENQRGDEVSKVLEIMGRSRKMNPVLVGDSEPQTVVKELLRRIENKELGISDNATLINVQVVSVEKEKACLSDNNLITTMIKELEGVIESRIKNGGVILDLGDLKWLVEKNIPAVVEIGRAAVAEIGNLLARFRGNEGNKLWLIGTATCETYLRCQVYHSTMECYWDLQAVPMASRSPLPVMFPRHGNERLLSNNPVEPLALSPLPALIRHVSEPLDPSQTTTFCLQCSESYEKELAKLTAVEKSFSEAKDEATRPSLPQWLQNAKLNTTEAKITTDRSQRKTQELQKKWRDTCLHLHPDFHQNRLYNPNPIFHGQARQLSSNQFTSQPLEATSSPPRSPVRTDLVLGEKVTRTTPEKVTNDQAKDFLSCISSKDHTKLLGKFSDALDSDKYKKLLKGIMEKAWWQAEAASKVATTVMRCRSGSGKRRSRGDVWLLFAGPNKVGKKKVASVLAEQICGATGPVEICLGARRDDDEELDRGKTMIDCVAEIVRKNPFSVIVLEDVDEAFMVVQESIERAIEMGRLVDSHGREVGLGNSIFIITGDWSGNNPNASRDGRFVDEDKLAYVASGDWQLGLIVREKGAKRCASWLEDDDRPPLLKPRTDGLSFDLNLDALDGEDDSDGTDGSHNLSDLSLDHEDDIGLVNRHLSSITSIPHDLIKNVDESIVFKPVDSAFVLNEIKNRISLKFSTIADENLSMEVEDDVLEKILGGLWHDWISLDEWNEKVLGPSFDRLKQQLPSGDRGSSVVRLVVESDSGRRGKSEGNGDWLPSSVLV